MTMTRTKETTQPSGSATPPSGPSLPSLRPPTASSTSGNSTGLGSQARSGDEEEKTSTLLNLMSEGFRKTRFPLPGFQTLGLNTHVSMQMWLFSVCEWWKCFRLPLKVMKHLVFVPVAVDLSQNGHPTLTNCSRAFTFNLWSEICPQLTGWMTLKSFSPQSWWSSYSSSCTTFRSKPPKVMIRDKKPVYANALHAKC